jgi:hypothetical protein
MSGVSAKVVLHLDRGFRVLLVAYFSVYSVIVVIFTVVAALHELLVALAPLAMLVVVVALGWRWSRVEVVGSDTDLIVRNLLTTRRIPRRSIDGFRLGGSSREFPGRAIRAVLEDGSTVVLTATGHYSAPNAGDEARLAQLQEWMRAPAPPLAGMDGAVKSTR